MIYLAHIFDHELYGREDGSVKGRRRGTYRSAGRIQATESDQTTMDSKLLTIVILSRDRPEFLEKCLRSVFENQKVVPNVIVSDNSTQDHVGIRKHRSDYPFTYVRQSGYLSMTEHHNACLKLPSTPWLWLVHDDDEIYPDSVVKVEAFLAGCGDVGIVLGGLEYIDPQGSRLTKWMPKTSGTFPWRRRLAPPGFGLWRVLSGHDTQSRGKP